jgi:hypothetical protein
MKVLSRVLIAMILLGCGSGVDENALPYLNGYWEIEKVVFPDGNTKAYQVNSSVDFIEIKDGRGFRKKVQPQFDGSFKTSDDAEQFRVSAVNGTLIMEYSNGEQRWEETLVGLAEDRFEVRSEDGVSYHYKRYQPLELD